MNILNKILIIGLLSLCAVQLSIAEQPQANDINLSESESEKVIATVKGEDSQVYSLIVKGDEHSASLYVQLDDKNSSKVLGGDSTPFPLARFGVKHDIAIQLADAYVAHEIEHTPGGLDTIKKRLQDRTHLPHDLLEAYSKVMTLSIKPFYAKQYTQLNEVINAMKELLNKTSKDDLNDFVARELRPLRYVTLESITKNTSSELLKLVVEASFKFNQLEEIQLSVAVFAGRQPKLFLKAYNALDAKSQASLKETLNKAIKSDLIGGKVLNAAQQTNKQL
ncbi:MAG: hypothetical protein KC646_16600 [Candidatus Cloacimonetes bacterium]|nr:hypothetical protein [Candidatus Cloacimonadota bacterium]